MIHPEAIMPDRLAVLLAATLVLLPTTGACAAEALDYAAYRARIEPFFLAKRPGHVRCYVCHGQRSNNAFRLESLPPGRATWTEEQSRRNFATVATLVVSGDPAVSRLLLHPLAPEAGGSAYHSGGRQFASTDDPDWKMLAQWVAGQKPSGPIGK